LLGTHSYFIVNPLRRCVKTQVPVFTAHIEAITKAENQTPLHFAARNDAVESTKTLVKLGADLEAKDYKNRTPIFVAAELGKEII